MLARALLLSVLVSTLALGQEAGLAVQVESATLRPKDAPTVEVGPGIYLPDARAREIARELAEHRSEPTPATTPVVEPAPGLVWVVLGGVLFVFVGGCAVGFVAAQAAE